MSKSVNILADDRDVVCSACAPSEEFLGLDGFAVRLDKMAASESEASSTCYIINTTVSWTHHHKDLQVRGRNTAGQLPPSSQLFVPEMKQ